MILLFIENIDDYGYPIQVITNLEVEASESTNSVALTLETN